MGHGIYYEFLDSEPFQESDCQKLKDKMMEIVKAGYPIYRRSISWTEAYGFFYFIFLYFLRLFPKLKKRSNKSINYMPQPAQCGNGNCR
jgi:hypothetical protein